MNQQQKRKNQKKHRDNMHKAFMEAFDAMSPLPRKPSYDVITVKKKK